MKWKKKTGAWRSSSPGCQFRIKLVGTLYELSVNTSETSWEKMHGYQSLEAAKESAEGLAEGLAEIIYNQERAVAARHAHAAKVANEDSEAKKFRKLVRVLLKVPKPVRERAYLELGWGPDAIKVLRETVDEVEESGAWV